jgi:hypothetical protein
VEKDLWAEVLERGNSGMKMLEDVKKILEAYGINPATRCTTTVGMKTTYADGYREDRNGFLREVPLPKEAADDIIRTISPDWVFSEYGNGYGKRRGLRVGDILLGLPAEIGTVTIVERVICDYVIDLGEDLQVDVFGLHSLLEELEETDPVGIRYLIDDLRLERYLVQRGVISASGRGSVYRGPQFEELYTKIKDLAHRTREDLV